VGDDIGSTAGEVDLTVVIPCHNVASTLGQQLDALTAQEWTGGTWRILVVDNGSTDETAAIARSYDNGPVPVEVLWATQGQGVAFARNAGIAAARSRAVTICDGDDVVQPGWVAAMGDALREHPLVGGLVDPSLVNDPWLASTRPLGERGVLPRFAGESFVSGGNCGMWRSLWEELGGYDETFRGLEDIEFSLRAHALGIEPTSVPEAVIGYRYREGLRPLWRQGFYYGRGRRELSRRARALGLAGGSWVAGLKSWAWLVIHLPMLRTRAGRYSWLWVLANRAGAARGLLDGRPPGEDVERAGVGAARPATSGRFHGVLITFRRPAHLVESLAALESQSVELDSLIVVDNDADQSVRDLVMNAGRPGDIQYLPLPGNPGPAGGIHAGVAEVLERAGDDDWVVLLDDDDPPNCKDALQRLRATLDEIQHRDPRCAGIGLWGAVLNRRSGRLNVATGDGPEPVDYLPGGACPHYSVRVLRRAGLPHPELFFGFDDLDLGLRIRDVGGRLYSSGLARQQGLSHMVDGRRASLYARPPTWRRYYSLRNLVIVLRAHHEIRGALVMSVLSGLLKPASNLLRQPRVATANLRLNYQALRDGWGGRSGKTIDPVRAGADYEGGARRGGPE
jgi:GT2 family glycosyltransferase